MESIKKNSKIKGYQIFTEILSDAKKKKGPYDIMVCYSGGKDSTYLLHLLKTKFKLKVLACSIIFDLVTDYSSANMEKITHKLGIDLIKFHIDKEIPRKFIQHGLLKYFKLGLGQHAGCSLCNYIKYTVLYNIAIQMNAPLIAVGIDQFQGPRYVPFDSDKYAQLSNIFREVFGDKYNDSIYVLDPDIVKNIKLPYMNSVKDFVTHRLKDSTLPRWIFPLNLRFIQYKEDVAYKLLKTLGFSKEDMTPSKTGCGAIPLFDYFSYQYHNCPTKIGTLGHRARRAYHNKEGGRTRETTIELVNEYRELLDRAVRNKNLHLTREDYKRSFPAIYKHGSLLPEIDWVPKIHYYAEYFGINFNT